MGRTLSITLTEAQRKELDHGFKTGNCHLFRQRCRMVLLKSQGMLTKDILPIVQSKSPGQVNLWIQKYKSLYSTVGISVLHNKEGQGRKPIFDTDIQSARIQEVVKQERQKLSNAKFIIEQEMNKTFHINTLKNFLKSLAANINESSVV